MVPVTYSVIYKDGVMVQTFPDDLLKLPVLPSGHGLYFKTNEGSFELPVSSLILSRLRLSGAIAANAKMLAASRGQMDRRSPILVRPHAIESYVVIDGNSTAANAILSKWQTIPCIWSADAGEH